MAYNKGLEGREVTFSSLFLSAQLKYSSARNISYCMLLLLLGERRIAIYWNYFQFHFKELHVKAVAMFLVLCDWAN